MPSKKHASKSLCNISWTSWVELWVTGTRHILGWTFCMYTVEKSFLNHVSHRVKNSIICKTNGLQYWILTFTCIWIWRTICDLATAVNTTQNQLTLLYCSFKSDISANPVEKHCNQSLFCYTAVLGKCPKHCFD